jgi:homoserine dehydrogenase
VVELVGGAEDARRYVLEALHRGRHVVTANKLLLAEHGLELERTAAEAGVRLIGSAAVGGAVPMLEAVERVAQFPGVRSFRGVLNGTTNFVLDRLADGLDFDRAVAKAQELGFAEADPSADLSGADAAAKAVLLGRVATGRPLGMQDVDVRGIDGPEVRTARPVLGERLRLVARGSFSDDGAVHLAVRPEWVSSDDPLGSVRDEENILIVTAADGSEAVVQGRGAGRRPTALAVMADLEEIRLQRALEDRATEPRVAEGVG